MIITFIEHCSDYDYPCIDIGFTDVDESFKLGVLFEKISNCNLCVWKGNDHLRIPLIFMDEIGLAIYYNSDALSKEILSRNAKYSLSENSKEKI